MASASKGMARVPQPELRLRNAARSDGISAGPKDIAPSFLHQALSGCTSFSSSAEVDTTCSVSSTEARSFVLQALETVSFPDSGRQNVRKQAGPGEDAGPPALGFNIGLTDDWYGHARVSKAARERPNLAKLLCAFARREIPGFCFTSIQVNKDYASAMHVDKNNVGTSYITGLGDYSGGRLWVDIGREHGRAVDLRGKWYCFDGNVPHCVLPFKGRRYTLVYFSRHQGGEISLKPCHLDLALSLRDLGFPLPTEISEKPHTSPFQSKQRVAAASAKFERYRAAFMRRPRALLKLVVTTGQHPEVHVSVLADTPVRLLLQAVAQRLRLGSPENLRLRVGSVPLLPGDTPRALGWGYSGSVEEVQIEELSQLERSPFLSNVSASEGRGQRRHRPEVDMVPEKCARRSERLDTTACSETKKTVNEEVAGEDVD